MAISSTFARGYLRKIWRDAQASGKTLLDLLEAAADSAQASAGSGKTIAATSGNGRSVTYQVNTGEATPADLCELTARLLDLYDAAHKHVFPSQSHNKTHTHTAEHEQELFDYMLGQLVAVTSVRSNFAVRLSR